MLRSKRPEHVELLPDVYLAPRSVTELFDAALSHYRDHFSLYMYTIALAVLPASLLQKMVYELWLKPMRIDQYSGTAYTTAAMFKGDFAVAAGLITGTGKAPIPGLLTIFLMFVGTAACTLVAAGILESKPVTPQMAVVRSLKRTGPLLAISVIIAAVSLGSLMAAYIVGGVVLIASASIPFPGANVAVGAVGILVVYFTACAPLAQHCFFAVQIVLIEGRSPWQVWDRNRLLVRQRRFRYALLSFACIPPILLLTGSAVIYSAYQLYEQLVVHPLAVHVSATSGVVAATVAANLLVIAILPYVAILITFLYYDFRMRRECIDLRLLAEQHTSTESLAQ